MRTINNVLIIDGGLVTIPGVNVDAHIGLPNGHSYACLAETMLLGLTGHDGHFSIGNPTGDQIATIARHADRFRHLGFEIAALRSFNDLINPIDVAATRPQPSVRNIVMDAFVGTALGY